MVAAQIYEIVFIPFQKSVKFCFFWRKMGGSWVGREHLEHSECLEHSSAAWKAWSTRRVWGMDFF